MKSFEFSVWSLDVTEDGRSRAQIKAKHSWMNSHRKDIQQRTVDDCNCQCNEFAVHSYAICRFRIVHNDYAQQRMYLLQRCYTLQVESGLSSSFSESL